MATITKTKSPILTTTKVAPTATKSAVTQTAAAVTASSANDTLTVIVMDAAGQPVAGANVSISPSNASAVTNNSGEVQFKLGTAKKYDVTATYSSNTVTVPYYVTANGATRLIVNPTYVKAVEAQLHKSSGISPTALWTTGIIVALVVIFFVIWKIKRRN